jgi:hypothetical protein
VSKGCKQDMADDACISSDTCTQVAELFGGKYTVLMVEDVEAEAEGGSASSALLGGSGSERPSGTGRASGAAAQAQALNTPRVAFQIVPAAQAQPPQVGVTAAEGSWVPACLGCIY